MPKKMTLQVTAKEEPDRSPFSNNSPSFKSSLRRSVSDFDLSTSPKPAKTVEFKNPFFQSAGSAPETTNFGLSSLLAPKIRESGADRMTFVTGGEEEGMSRTSVRTDTWGPVHDKEPALKGHISKTITGSPRTRTSTSSVSERFRQSYQQSPKETSLVPHHQTACYAQRGSVGLRKSSERKASISDVIRRSSYKGKVISIAEDSTTGKSRSSTQEEMLSTHGSSTYASCAKEVDENSRQTNVGYENRFFDGLLAGEDTRIRSVSTR